MAGSATAQTTNAIDAVRENARSHVGPFYITPELVLRDLGVDSNVFNDSDPKSDFMFTLGPRADIAVPFANRLLLQTRVGADFIYYQKYSDQRSVSPRVAPRVTVFFNRLSLFGEGTYSRSRQRPNYEIDVRALRTERMVGGGIDYEFSPKLVIELAARTADVKYAAGETFLDVSLRETLNRKSDTYATTVRYALTPLTTIVMKAEQTQDRFEFSHERDADTLRLTPGVEFNARALISGSAYVGVRRFNTKSEQLEDFNGLVASATLAYTLLGRTAFIVSAERDVTYSFERYQPYFVVNNYGLTVRHRLAGRFDVTGGAARYRYNYRDLALPNLGVPATLPAEERVDVTRSYSTSLGYYLAPDLRVGIGTTYWKRESSFNVREYNALRTGVSIDYGF